MAPFPVTVTLYLNLFIDFIYSFSFEFPLTHSVHATCTVIKLRFLALEKASLLSRFKKKNYR